MSKASLKVGDKVRVKSHIAMPRHGWGVVRHGDVGTVVRHREDGVTIVDFPSQKSWAAKPSEMEVVAQAAKQPVLQLSPEPVTDKPKRKSPEKVLAYGVMQNGELHRIVYDRDVARSAKAKLGGKSAGATIVVLTAGKEIR